MHNQRSKAFLEYKPGDDELTVRTPIEPFPFVIGRSRPAHLLLYSRKVSKAHAEIQRVGDVYYIRDLESRNGTFLNGERISRAALRNGDVIHVAHLELRFNARQLSEPLGDSTLGAESQLEAIVQGVLDIQRILSEGKVKSVFQPIVDLKRRWIYGYEALGRNGLEGASYGPGELFMLAAQRGKTVELSRMLRRVALVDAASLPRGGRLFLNMHPDELTSPHLDSILDEIAATAEPLGLQPVIEFHEAAVTSVSWLRKFRARLAARGLGLAYDDFGAGQSRLMELAEVPPDFIKLDMGLIRDIDRSASRRALVRVLTEHMRSMGVQVLAEGVETEAEHEHVKALGCIYGQGYLYHRPAPADSFQS